MTLTDKTILVTGANRGLGQALVEEALTRGAQRVYAASRQPFSHPDDRVTRRDHGRHRLGGRSGGSAESVESLDILINNAGRVPAR